MTRPSPATYKARVAEADEEAARGIHAVPPLTAPYPVDPPEESRGPAGGEPDPRPPGKPRKPLTELGTIGKISRLLAQLPNDLARDRVVAYLRSCHEQKPPAAVPCKAVPLGGAP